MKFETETLFHRGDYFFDALLKECKKARKEILLEAYIFETDILGKKLLKVLKKKAYEGVTVKILIDGIGSYSFCPLLFKKLNHKNFEIRFYNPLPFQLPHNKRHSMWTFLKGFFNGLIQINHRNHRKTYLIDGRIGFIGSINITRLHSKRFHGERFWRDTGIRLKDERVFLLREAFLRSWDYHLNPKDRYLRLKDIFHITKSGLRLNDCFLSRSLQYEDLIERIKSSKDNIWITNPYFVPPPDLTLALTRAAQRGVSVKIIIPRKSDMKLFPLINSLASRKLVEEQVEVYEYRPRILHAKIFIIDDWCILGSSNLNNRSLKHDLEVDVVLRDQESKTQLLKQFRCDLQDSVKVEKHDILKRYGEGLHHYFLINIVRYWL